jgi:hypothetical protein
LAGVVAVECDLGAGLTASTDRAVLLIRFPGACSAIKFDALNDRVTASLVFGSASIAVNVSFQPGAIVREIDQTAREWSVDPNRWRVAILSELREWSGSLDWCEPFADNLLAAVGAVTHPLLACVYERGAEPLSELPRWALPVLRSLHATHAGRALAGEQSNRRLARAVVSSLIAPDGQTVALGLLALGVIGAGLVTADELANVLETPTNGAGAAVPSVDEITAARRGLALFPPGRRAALLIDTARHHDAHALAATMTQLWWVKDHAERPLPAKLKHLTELVARLVPALTPAAVPATLAPAPACPHQVTPTADQLELDIIPHPADTPPTSATHAATARTSNRPAPVDNPALAPAAAPLSPAVRRQATIPLAPPTEDGSHPASWPVPQALSRINRHRGDGLLFDVPTSNNELAWWGRELYNCLATYGGAVYRQESWLIGVRRDDRLIACAEVVPSTRRVRQLLGPRNQPLPHAVHHATLRALTECGVTPASHR